MEWFIPVIVALIAATPPTLAALAGWRRARAAHQEVRSPNGGTTGEGVQGTLTVLLALVTTMNRLAEAVEALTDAQEAEKD